MKREIKFRLWDSKNHKWFIKGENGLVENMVCCDSWDMFDPDDYVWCQYTGLHDKNGQSIYEGDIVRTGKDNIGDPEPMIGQVIMREGSWLIENEKKQEAIDLFSEITSREVIGNIFEDKQLLEGKQ